MRMNHRLVAAACGLLSSGVLLASGEDVAAEVARIEAISDVATARAAVKALSSADVLAAIARTSASWRLRADAIYFLTDQSVLTEVFAGDPDWRVKASCLYHIADAAFLERIAFDGSFDARVRAVATSRLRDRDMLERLTKDSADVVRLAAKGALPPDFTEASEVPVPLASFTNIEDITRPTP